MEAVKGYAVTLTTTMTLRVVAESPEEAQEIATQIALVDEGEVKILNIQEEK